MQLSNSKFQHHCNPLAWPGWALSVAIPNLLVDPLLELSVNIKHLMIHNTLSSIWCLSRCGNWLISVSAIAIHPGTILTRHTAGHMSDPAKMTFSSAPKSQGIHKWLSFFPWSLKSSSERVNYQFWNPHYDLVIFPSSLLPASYSSSERVLIN